MITRDGRGVWELFNAYKARLIQDEYVPEICWNAVPGINSKVLWASKFVRRVDLM